MVPKPGVATLIRMASSSAWLAAAAVGIGSAFGALLRWRLGESLNGLHPWLPMGTLAANLLGGYLVGIALAVFVQQPSWPDALRLFVVTGFLGGLTTFSTFSAEVVALLQQGRPMAGLVTAALHLAGSLAATAGGFASVEAARKLGAG